MRKLLLARASMLALVVGAATAGAAQAGSFGYTGTIQTYDVMASGEYRIVAQGAQGGEGGLIPAGFANPPAGGPGAAVGGNLFLTSGTVLDIVVGGEGATGFYSGGGGGGGSFVFVPGTALPLAVAGGGALLANGGGGAGWKGSGGAGKGIESGGGGSGLLAGGLLMRRRRG